MEGRVSDNPWKEGEGRCGGKSEEGRCVRGLRAGMEGGRQAGHGEDDRQGMEDDRQRIEGREMDRT